MIRRITNWHLPFTINTGGWVSVIVVIAATVILLLTLARVVVNARDNYQVYVFEREGLVKLQLENEDLQKQLEYYQSYEYKQLYARDNLHLAEPGGTLYKVVGAPEYYKVPERQLDLLGQNGFISWWQLVL